MFDRGFSSLFRMIVGVSLVCFWCRYFENIIIMSILILIFVHCKKIKTCLNDYADQRPQIGRTRGCMEGSLPLVVSSVLQNNFPELCTAFCKVTLKRQFAALQVFNFLLSCIHLWFFITLDFVNFKLLISFEIKALM